MRKVRFLVSLAGLSVSYMPGQIYELTDDVAEKFADGVRAQYVDEPDPEPDATGEATGDDATPSPRRKRG